MAHIEKRKYRSGKIGWRVKWTDRTGQQQSWTCRTRSAAAEIRRRIEDEQDRGRDYHPGRRDALDLREVLGRWLISRQPHVGKGRMATLNLAVSGFCEHLLREHPRRTLTPALLTRSNLEGYLARMGSLNPNTAGVRVRQVERAWEWAYAVTEWEGQIPRPAPRLETPTAPTIHRPAPTWAEMDAVVRVGLASPMGWYGRLYALARFTGLRSTQVRRLEWRDVDIEQRLLVVRPELGKSHQERQGRTIPISPHLVAEMAGWGKREGLIVSTGRRRKGVRHIAVPLVRVRQHWKKAGVREAVWKAQPGRRGSPLHSFRHGFITGLLAAGIEEHLVNRLVGHQQATQSTGNYADWDRLLLGQLRTAVAKIPPLTPAAAEALTMKKREG